MQRDAAFQRFFGKQSAAYYASGEFIDADTRDLLLFCLIQHHIGELHPTGNAVIALCRTASEQFVYGFRAVEQVGDRLHAGTHSTLDRRTRQNRRTVLLNVLNNLLARVILIVFNTRNRTLDQNAVRNAVDCECTYTFRANLRQFKRLAVKFILQPSLPVGLVGHVIGLAADRQRNPSEAVGLLCAQTNLARVQRTEHLLDLRRTVGVAFRAHPCQSELHHGIACNVGHIEFAAVCRRPHFAVDAQARTKLYRGILRRFHCFFLDFHIGNDELSGLFL